jgi:proteasome accessory factor C
VSGAADQLTRLLALLPYVMSHPGVTEAELARQFGVDARQIRRDLMLAFVCGLPGHLPDDLIEVAWDTDGGVTVRNADAVRRPLRLSVDEALALTVALRTLAELPGADDAVHRALAKVERAAGAVAEATGGVSVAVEAEPDVVPVLREALDRRRRVHLRYWVPARDEETERDVDPLRLLVAGGRTYLWGWCRLVEDLRTFRTDRVVAVSVLDAPSDPPAEARTRPLPESLFTPSAADRVVTLRLAPAARWVPEYYPCDVVREEPDGSLVVRVRSREDGWLVRLALRLGPAAEVLDPADLADAVRGEAGAALAGYG